MCSIHAYKGEFERPLLDTQWSLLIMINWSTRICSGQWMSFISYVIGSALILQSKISFTESKVDSKETSTRGGWIQSQRNVNIKRPSKQRLEQGLPAPSHTSPHLRTRTSMPSAQAQERPLPLRAFLSSCRLLHSSSPAH